MSVPPGARVVRVLPDVAAIDKEFDYWVPPAVHGQVRVGSVVRVDLHGRRVGGWVVADAVDSLPGMDLRPLARVSGWGPEPALLDLAAWAAWRWAGRRCHFLGAASPGRAVAHLPAPSGSVEVAGGGAGAGGGEVASLAEAALSDGGGWGHGGTRVIRLAPAVDPTPVVLVAAGRGSTLVVVPSAARAGVLAHRLRARGLAVALLPDDWAAARAGAAVVVGTRGAAWAPCPDLAAVVVVDGHDEGLAQEAAPTWNALDVVAERARRAGVPCIVTSACPTPELAVAPLLLPGRALERRGWAPLEVVDRRGDDPRLGLWSRPLSDLVHRGGRVACVLNRKGRARLLACAVCAELVRCERCGAALGETAGGSAEEALACPRCGLERPSLCAACGSIRLKRLRVGVSRAREELEALAGRPAAEVTGSTAEIPSGAGLLIGTEAVLQRSGSLDAVAFVDFDQELLAPRFRAGADALAMLARASRLVGGRRRGGRVLVQTRIPDHPVLGAAASADPGPWLAAEVELRSALRLPPAAALARVSGPAGAAYAEQLRGVDGLEVLGPAGEGEKWLVRAPDSAALADGLAATARPAGRLRVEVDPWRV